MTRLHLPLVEGSPLWGRVGGPLLPRLEGRHRCEVAIVGGGLVGLALALGLRKRGIPCLVVEADRIGAGSTAASTALLLWETDVDLRELSRRMGSERAASIWRSCLETVDELETIAGDGGLPSFERVESVYYASEPEDESELREEAEARARAGLPSRFVEDPGPWVGFRAPGAIVSRGAGLIDPVVLLRTLLERCLEEDIPVYERSPAHRVTGRGVEGSGFALSSDRVVVTAGLRSMESFGLPPLVHQRQTYVLAVEGDPPGWRRDVIAWSTARPYSYMRRAKGAVVMGGQDLAPRQARRAGSRPYARLRARLEELYPGLRGAHETARWSGLFPNSPDSLPYVGRVPDLDGAHAVLGFGGNGLVFGLLGARLLARSLSGEDLEQELTAYAYDRLSRLVRTRLRVEDTLQLARLR